MSLTMQKYTPENMSSWVVVGAPGSRVGWNRARNNQRTNEQRSSRITYVAITSIQQNKLNNTVSQRWWHVLYASVSDTVVNRQYSSDQVL